MAYLLHCVLLSNSAKRRFFILLALFTLEVSSIGAPSLDALANDDDNDDDDNIEPHDMFKLESSCTFLVELTGSEHMDVDDEVEEKRDIFFLDEK